MRPHWHEDDVEQLSPDEFRAYCREVPGYVNEQDHFGYTPLVAACTKGNAAVARALLETGADPNFVASDGESPLKAAVPSPGKPFNRELFDLLLAAGANPNLGLEPVLHAAVARGDRELVTYLVRRGADPNLDDVDGSPPLFWAGVYGGRPDIEMMRVLVGLGADPARRDGVGTTLEERIGPYEMRRVMTGHDE
ncbi:MAG TPA: ankyrin repeat domain-containing protein [Humisphaera sp.]